jgi:putative tricarboxylic transport membrane protein
MVEFIAPSGAGGGWDAICRFSALVLGRTGLVTQPIYVVNMPGGGGTVGLNYVVTKREGDAHLLIAASNSTSFRMAMKVTPHTYDDITPIAQIAAEYGAYVVLVDSPYQTLGDVVNALKADPGSVSVAGGSAPGSMDHIKVALLGKAIGIDPLDMAYVPFQGGGEALAALLGGHVDMASLDVSEIEGQLEAGKVRVLAVQSEDRLSGFPDLPTAVEQGVDVVFVVWRGLYMPAGLPEGAVEFWTDALQQMVASPQWAEYIPKAWEPVTRFGDEFVSYVDQELEDYKILLAELGFL